MQDLEGGKREKIRGNKMREKDGGKPITGQQKHWMAGLPAPDARPRRRPEARESPVDCKISIGRFESSQIIKGKFDSWHHNSVNLGVMLKIMPLNGMIFNMRSNFKKLEWHRSN